MNAQQLRQAPATIRRTFGFPVIGIGLVAALVLAAALALNVRRPAPMATAPAEQPAYIGYVTGTGSVYDGGAYGEQAAVLERWSPGWMPGGHATGSVYDGGAYGVAHAAAGEQPVARPTPWPNGTGSVYDGR